MGAEDEFRVLYESYYEAVMRYAQRRSGARVAADVAADVFTVVWRRMAEMPPEPLPWIYGIARMTLANHVRGQARQEALSARWSAEPTASERDIGEVVSTRWHIHDAWASLAPDDRELLALIGWEGLTVRQAARSLGCTTATCSVRLHRARARLRKALDSTPAVPRAPMRTATLEGIPCD